MMGSSIHGITDIIISDSNGRPIKFITKHIGTWGDSNKRIYHKEMLKNMGIKEVIFNDYATVVILNNGNKGVAKRSMEDIYDPIIGISVAYAIAIGTKGNKSWFKENVQKLLSKSKKNK